MAKILRIKFLILMIISTLGAGLTLNLAVPGRPLYIPWVCISAVFILTFLISGVGLFANLYQWIAASKEKE